MRSRAHPSRDKPPNDPRESYQPVRGCDDAETDADTNEPADRLWQQQRLVA